MARLSLSRSNSSTSTLSCITVANDPQPGQNPPQSSTPPTSVTDAASISSTNTPKGKPSNMNSVRSRRVKCSVSSYNENILAGSARKRSANSSETAEQRNDRRGRQFVQDSADTLAIGWRLEDMPGDDIGMPVPGYNPAKSRSLRSQLLTKASAAVAKTKSVLGKRGRDTMEAGKDTLQALGRRTSLRLIDSTKADITASNEPVSKKIRIDESVPQAARGGYRPKPKLYLAQGLYVGQESGFNPRFKESNNKNKKALITPRSRTMLPPLMFAGETLLDQGRNFRLPYNIFSPLPPGQPKPEEWRKTQKNVFVGDAAEFWKTSKNLEHSTCICEPESGCDENCFNRFMFYECDSNNCNIGLEHCTNRSFEELRKRCKKGGKYNIGVEVIKTADRGYGVRSNRTFEPNQIIVEYTGEIITQDECDHRMKKSYKNNECFYLMVFDQNMIIDATRGSIARFVNHSCDPNCKMVKWTVAGKPRMALFAGDKAIMTGEELTYDYNFDPFSSKNIQECRCGAPLCRGVLGPRPKEKELKDALKPIAQVGTKRKLQEAIDGAKDAVQAVVGRKRKATSSVPKTTLSHKDRAIMKRAKSIGLAKGQNGRSDPNGSHNSLKRISRKTPGKKRPSAKVVFKSRGSQNSANRKKSVVKVARARGTSSSVSKHVVHTVKGTTAHARTAGRNIKVIS